MSLKQHLVNIRTHILAIYQKVLQIVLEYIKTYRQLPVYQEQVSTPQAPMRQPIRKINLLPYDTLSDIIPPTPGDELPCYNALMRLAYEEQPTTTLPTIKPESPQSTRKLAKVRSHVRGYNTKEVITFDGEEQPFVQVFRLPEKI